MNLSEHFTKEEMIYSDTAKAYHINNEPNTIQLKVLTHTCQYFLEPLRKLLNDSYKVYNNKQVRSVLINITSGLRTLTLNRKIGSKDNSQHITGEAVDMDVTIVLINGTRVKLPYTELYSFIKNKVREGKISVDQCICEHSGNATWVHCSYKAAGSTVNRKQFLKYDGKSYILD